MANKWIIVVLIVLILLILYNAGESKHNPDNNDCTCKVCKLGGPYKRFVVKENNELDDGTLAWYYNYKPSGDRYYFGKNEANPPPTLKPGANTMKRPGNAYLMEYPKNESQRESYVTTVRLLTNPSCRMSKLESAFWNTKKEVQGMGALGEMIDFKVELYDYANPANLKYKLPVVVKEIPGNPPQLMKFNDLSYGPRSDVMIQWVFGDGRVY